MTTIPALTISISSLTSSTAPGDTVNYTLTIADTGQTTYAGATVTDSLADVLDDATSKGGAVATSGAVSFAAPDLTWTGAGQRRSRLGGTGGTAAASLGTVQVTDGRAGVAGWTATASATDFTTDVGSLTRPGQTKIAISVTLRVLLFTLGSQMCRSV
jgi:uncharacterized repeat protein (TIGR01451 family)